MLALHRKNRDSAYNEGERNLTSQRHPQVAEQPCFKGGLLGLYQASAKNTGSEPHNSRVYPRSAYRSRPRLVFVRGLMGLRAALYHSHQDTAWHARSWFYLCAFVTVHRSGPPSVSTRAAGLGIVVGLAASAAAATKDVQFRENNHAETTKINFRGNMLRVNGTRRAVHTTHHTLP